MHRESGFSLMELMIVVAIIGILAAIAIPAYQDFVVRGKVSEGLSLGTGATKAIVESYHSRGALPDTNEEAGLVDHDLIVGNHTESVQVGPDGLVTVTFADSDATIDGKTLQLSPLTNTGSIQWSCNSTTIATRYLPATCR